MLSIDIQGFGDLKLSHLVCDLIQSGHFVTDVIWSAGFVYLTAMVLVSLLRLDIESNPQ